MPALVPPSLTQTVLTTDCTAFDADSQDFNRVHWAKCQARAERYEEEVKLTVEEMGRTLRYFEWKRDWWLSLKPESSDSNHPSQIRDGLCAYACRQSHLYDNLVTLYVTHWRTYLTSHSLGSSWLGKYASHAASCTSLIPSHPSRTRQEVDADPGSTATTVSALSKPPSNLQLLVDSPLDSGSEDGVGRDNNVISDTEGEMDPEDMFADD